MVRSIFMIAGLWCVASCASTTERELLELRRSLDALKAREAKLTSQVADLSHQMLLLNERRHVASEVAKAPEHLEVVRLVPPQKNDAWQGEAAIDIDMVGEPEPSGERLKIAKIPPAPVHKAPASTPEADKAFREALQAFRDGKTDDAYQRFGAFVRNYPTHADVEGAQFWMGEARFEAQAYAEAIEAYVALVQKHPTSGKVPDALWKTGLAYERLGKSDAAKEAFQKLLRGYPKSSLADIARERLGGGA